MASCAPQPLTVSLGDITLRTIKHLGDHFPGGFFIYEAAAPERLLYANTVVFEIFGCSSEQEFRELTGYTFKGMVHPDDYRLKTKSIEAQIAFTHNQMDHVIYRIIRKDGAVRWIDDYGHYAETEEHGGVYSVFISDITESRLRMEANQAVHTAVIDALSNAYETVLLVTDVQSESLVLYKATAKTPVSFITRLLGLVRYSLVTEEYISTCVAPEDRDWVREQVRLENILKSTASKPQFDITFRRLTDGQCLYYRAEFIRVRLPNGKDGFIYGFKNVDPEVRRQQQIHDRLQKVTDEKMQKEEELSKALEAAMIDALTGVKNKRCFEMMKRRVDRKAASGDASGYAVVICDINNLKKINDAWGHIEGDRCIKESCKMICRTFKHSPVFRLGGDEFAVILTGQDYENRHALMKELALKAGAGDGVSGMTLASGMAVHMPGQDAGISSVIERADRLMYENKRLLKQQAAELPAA